MGYMHCTQYQDIYLLIDERALMPSNKSFKMHFAAFIVFNHKKIEKFIVPYKYFCNTFILVNFCKPLININFGN